MKKVLQCNYCQRYSEFEFDTLLWRRTSKCIHCDDGHCIPPPLSKPNAKIEKCNYCQKYTEFVYDFIGKSRCKLCDNGRNLV